MSEERLNTKAQLEEFVQKWQSELPPQIVPVVQDHYANLVAMAGVLRAAGHKPEDIRQYVRQLIASYERRLLEAIEVEEDR